MEDHLKSIYRTHHCNALGLRDLDQDIVISGWVHSKRDHGGVLFLDIRDHYGMTQVVTSMQEEGLRCLDAEDYQRLQSISLESVVTIKGKVIRRPDETVNKNIATGEVEILIKSYEVQSEASVLPFPVNTDQHLSDELRLRYRFLDLRRHKVHEHIMLRSRVIYYIRNAMIGYGFTEFQTPILTSSSPEGARDFLVPSRLHPGKFYALPQAPQQFKQLLMVAGFDRYFQIAPCFRDEDPRADRAPGDFYQLDVEMSFVTQEEVFVVVEKLMHGLFTTFSTFKVTDVPFPRIKYRDAMLRYGSDKPDLRNPIEIHDVTDLFASSNFSIFRDAIKNKGYVVRAIPVPNLVDKPRSFFDNLVLFAQNELKAAGLAYVTFAEDGQAKGPIAKVLQAHELEQLRALNPKCDTVFFVCEKESTAAKMSGRIRQKLGEDLDLITAGEFKFCWIVDFPMYEWNEEDKKVDFSHNPFSMPQGGLQALQDADTPEKQLSLLAYQYDLVCNGVELSSGAIRNHNPEIMYKAFAIAGYSPDVVDDKFGGMVRAFRYGAPPHGGIAPGIDRIVMLLAGVHNIREVIAFPLNQSGEDLMMSAPSEVTLKQLRELGIRVVESKK